jgi:thiol:disulfide interchange protein DsbA
MQLMGSYKVDGVPMLVVNGKYVTSNAAAGGPERVVPIVEQLIAMARKDMGVAAAPAAAPKPVSVKK